MGKDKRKSSNEPIRRISNEFAKELDSIKETRLKIGMDTIKHIQADWRLTLAMVRHPNFKKMEEDIINATLD